MQFPFIFFADIAHTEMAFGIQIVFIYGLTINRGRPLLTLRSVVQSSRSIIIGDNSNKECIVR
jgi:hypothetical protein